MTLTEKIIQDILYGIVTIVNHMSESIVKINYKDNNWEARRFSEAGQTIYVSCSKHCPMFQTTRNCDCYLQSYISVEFDKHIITCDDVINCLPFALIIKEVDDLTEDEEDLIDEIKNKVVEELSGYSYSTQF
jgi:hypothetical protein